MYSKKTIAAFVVVVLVLVTIVILYHFLGYVSTPFDPMDRELVCYSNRYPELNLGGNISLARQQHLVGFIVELLMKQSFNIPIVLRMRYRCIHRLEFQGLSIPKSRTARASRSPSGLINKQQACLP